MKCVLKFEAGRWYCLCEDLFTNLEAFPTPDPAVEGALRAFQHRYYPEESGTSKHNPWIQHADGLEVIKPSIIRHELTWHWRLLLPCLRETQTLAAGESIVLSVSQIRQWQLVSCFTMRLPKQLTLSGLRGAEKRLLRSPVFGRSHRVRQAEVYASFYSPGVLKQLQEAVAQAGDDGFRLAHVVGRYDAYLRVTKTKWVPGSELFELELDYVADLEPEQAPLVLNGIDSQDVCRPYGVAHMAQFAENKGSIQQPKVKAQPSRELLFSSDNYCAAMEQVSDVVNDPSAKAVLLIAPPGSGKEGLSDLFHSARRAKGGKLVKTMLAGLNERDAAKRLFTLSGNQVARFADLQKKRFVSKAGDGALFQALAGTLVIDELDKADDAIRHMLLRLLENDEVALYDTTLTIQLPVELRPIYVFVGSLPRKEFLQKQPIDFWSRLTHIVEMRHPLELEDEGARRRALQDYLRFFWLRQVNDFFEAEKLLVAHNATYEPLRISFASWWRFFISRGVGEFVTRELADAMLGPGQPAPSVRTLRGTVARCFNLLFHAILYNKRRDAPLEEWLDAEKPADVQAALGELVAFPGNFSQSKRVLNAEKLAALNEIKSLIRSSASIHV